MPLTSAAPSSCPRRTLVASRPDCTRCGTGLPLEPGLSTPGSGLPRLRHRDRRLDGQTFAHSNRPRPADSTKAGAGVSPSGQRTATKRALSTTVGAPDRLCWASRSVFSSYGAAFGSVGGAHAPIPRLPAALTSTIEDCGCWPFVSPVVDDAGRDPGPLRLAHRWGDQ